MIRSLASERPVAEPHELVSAAAWQYDHEIDLDMSQDISFLLLIENKRLTKIIGLAGNDLEISGLLYSAYVLH